MSGLFTSLGSILSNGGGATSFSDDFNRANSGTLGANWVDQGTAGWGIDSNAARMTATGSDRIVYCNEVFGDDQEAETDISEGNGELPFVMLRSNGTDTYYAANRVQIYKFVGGLYTPVFTLTDGGTAATLLKFRAFGTTLSVFKEGVLIDSTTDSSIASGSRIGMGGFSSSGAISVTNFTATEV